jgi:cell division transport system ATP-binding protein
MNTLIAFSNAGILNGEVPVLYGVNLEISRGDFVYIIGKVGTGKTSIIRTLTGENRLGGGEASVCGFSLGKLRPKDIPLLRRKIGVVFQDFQLLMDRSVEDNLRFALQATGWKDKAAMAERIEHVLEAVGLQHKAHKLPHQLSGGEQQRAAIARALLNEPALILADEPTGNLDEETARSIMGLLFDINRRGTAILMVTHNLALVRAYPARVITLENGICREEVPAPV